MFFGLLIMRKEKSDNMNQIVVRKVDDFYDYDYIIYPTTYINPLLKQALLNEILKKETRKRCKILFDLLLCNGDCFNRFCKGIFDGNKMLDDSLDLVEISDNEKIKYVEKYYANNKGALKKGVLVPREYMVHC